MPSWCWALVATRRKRVLLHTHTHKCNVHRRLMLKLKDSPSSSSWRASVLHLHLKNTSSVRVMLNYPSMNLKASHVWKNKFSCTKTPKKCSLSLTQWSSYKKYCSHTSVLQRTNQKPRNLIHSFQRYTIHVRACNCSYVECLTLLCDTNSAACSHR